MSPGQSIQDAINAASPGSTINVRPGTYFENVWIDKDAITLKGTGPGPTIIEPSEGAPQGPCVFDPEFFPGVCVIGEIDFNTFEVTRHTRGARILNLTIGDFPNGVIVFGGQGTLVQGNTFTDNEVYGVFAFESSSTQIISNNAFGSDEAGIYIGDSSSATAAVRNNHTWENGIGIFLRSAVRGSVTGNNVHDNCVGIFLLGEPNPSGDWTISGNQVNHNTEACPGDEGPALSGIGILVLGANRNIISLNTVDNNFPTGPSEASGGIILVEGTGNVVSSNRAHGNVTHDIQNFATGTRFSGNRCSTSIPGGLCAFP